MENFGVFVGRFCPIHIGHEKVVRAMLAEYGAESSLAVIGSSNAPLSLRNFFSYTERKNFLKKIFPGLRVIGLPDYFNNQEWMDALDDILMAIFGGEYMKRAIFFGGCEEDIRFFLEFGRKYKLLNRFDGTTPKISATEVRDALIHKRSLKELLNPLVAEDVKELFSEKWDRFKKI